MQVPLQIVFEHIAPVDYIEDRVREEVKKLEQFYDRITSARVVVGRPQHRHHKGDTYSVRVHLTIPGAEDIVVSRDPAATGRHENVQVTITDTFDAARRQLQDVVRKRQGQVKTHEVPPHGIIRVLFPERDHGFIASDDGRDIYFHRNSVADGKFDSLEVGQEVRFSETLGVKGPQATIVRPVGKHHVD
jgi:cold shock CspA family protein/ribosome-associated translation inhibitor RaiA